MARPHPYRHVLEPLLLLGLALSTALLTLFLLLATHGNVVEVGGARLQEIFQQGHATGDLPGLTEGDTLLVRGTVTDAHWRPNHPRSTLMIRLDGAPLSIFVREGTGHGLLGDAQVEIRLTVVTRHLPHHGADAEWFAEDRSGGLTDYLILDAEDVRVIR